MDKTELTVQWKRLLYKPEKLNTVIPQLHHAVQFISAFGKSYITNKPDNSHLSMVWIMRFGLLAGYFHRLTKLRLALNPETFTLMLLNMDYREFARIPLDGKSKDEVFKELKGKLNYLKLNEEKLQIDLQYEIPDYSLKKKDFFKMEDKNLFREYVKYQHNTNLILMLFARRFEKYGQVRTWPQHFNIGNVITLESDENKKALKTIGLGWAIPDENITEPYFYVNHWCKDFSPDYSNLPALDGNGYWNQNGSTVAVFPISEIIKFKDIESQVNTVYDFFKSGINGNLDLLDENKLKL